MRAGLYFGRRRQGKSTLALHHALQGRGGVVIYDINAQFSRFPTGTTSDLAEFDSLVSSSDERVVVYRPADNVLEEFSGVCACLWSRQGYTLLLDEASQVQSASSAHPSLDRLMRMAPPDLRILQTLHRPRDSATLCRSLATDWWIFRTTLERDLEVIEEHCGPEVREAVANFKEGSHTVYHWDDALGCGSVFYDPASWYEVI